MEEGIVYETLNLASLKSLPIIFICEKIIDIQFTLILMLGLKHLISTIKLNHLILNILKISDYKIEKIFKKVKEAIDYTKINRSL